MIIHELNTGTINPEHCATMWGAPFVVCRSLLIDTGERLVAVDAGIGLHDIADPRGRLGDDWLSLARPSLDPAEALISQVESLGYNPADVRDIFLTHHHRDHIGGLADFPCARIHALPEAKRSVEALAHADPDRLAQWEHGPRWAPEPSPAELWEGRPTFTAEGIDPRVRFLPLAGHCRGHAGILVEFEPGYWLLHAGDAAFHPAQFTDEPVPAGPVAFAQMTQDDPVARRDTEDLLTSLHANPRVRILTAHGPA